MPMLLITGSISADPPLFGKCQSKARCSEARGYTCLCNDGRPRNIDAEADVAIRAWQSGIEIFCNGVMGPRCRLLLEIGAPVQKANLAVAKLAWLLHDTKSSYNCFDIRSALSNTGRVAVHASMVGHRASHLRALRQRDRLAAAGRAVETHQRSGRRGGTTGYYWVLLVAFLPCYADAICEQPTSEVAVEAARGQVPACLYRLQPPLGTAQKGALPVSSSDALSTTYTESQSCSNLLPIRSAARKSPLTLSPS